MRQVDRHHFAHPVHAQGVDQPGQRLLARRLNRPQQVISFFIGKTFQLEQIISGQGVQISHIAYQTGIHQLFHDFGAQPDDIHRPAPDKMLNIADQLRRTGCVDTIPGYLAFQVFHRLSAGRAGLRCLENTFAAIPLVHHRSNHVWDHIAGPLEQHPVANADIFLPDVVEIMQRGLFDHHAAHLHRLEVGIRASKHRSAQR